MSEDENVDENVGPDELTLLKERADTMGITYHPNIGVDKLKAKVEGKMNGEPVVDPNAAEEVATINEAGIAASRVTFTPGRRESVEEITNRKRKEATRLVRIRVTNMNPNTSNLLGVVKSVGNAQIGMIKKFVPFNAEQGWHVPKIILNQLKNQKFMSHYTIKVGNKSVNKHKLIPEYAIEILDPLTPQELDDLKQRQLMAAGH